MRGWLTASSKTERSKTRRTEKRLSDLQNSKSLMMLAGEFSAGVGPGSLQATAIDKALLSCSSSRSECSGRFSSQREQSALRNGPSSQLAQGHLRGQQQPWWGRPADGKKVI